MSPDGEAGRRPQSTRLRESRDDSLGLGLAYVLGPTFHSPAGKKEPTNEDREAQEKQEGLCVNSGGRKGRMLGSIWLIAAVTGFIPRNTNHI